MMKKYTSFLTLFLFFSCFFAFSQNTTQTTKQNTTANARVALESTPPTNIRFSENKNQWDKEVRYKADIPSGFLFLYERGIQYSFYNTALLGENHLKAGKISENFPKKDILGHSFSIDFVDSEKNPKLISKFPTKEQKHYYIGDDKANWAENVQSYQEIYYQNLYKNIDYRLYAYTDVVKYEFIVAPKANPNKIKMLYKGAKSIQISANGDLAIETELGKITEFKPFCYQFINEQKVLVRAEFKIKQKDTETEVSFNFPDSYNKDYELIIDPEVVFSTYSGGVSDNWGNTSTFDDEGNLYSGANVYGINFPRVIGVIKIGTLGNSNDTFTPPLKTDMAIFKYNPTGTTLERITFIGGNSSEVPHSLVVDKDRNLVGLGTTSSTNFPTTTGTTFQGGTAMNLLGNSYPNGSDLCIFKLNPDGTLRNARLLGGTADEGIKQVGYSYIHNYGDEFRGDVITDDFKNIFVASTTRSNSIAGIGGSLQGSQDGLVIKFDENLNIVWGNYIGGNDFDTALSIKLNSTGTVYVGGGTTSNDLPNTTGAYQATAVGSDDGFIAKIAADGTVQQITYLGTTSADMAFFIDLDSEDKVYALGQTYGSYPITAGTYGTPNAGQFIQKFGADLTTSEWSSAFGSGDGAPDINLTAFLVVAGCGNIYISGWGGAINQNANFPRNLSSDTKALEPMIVGVPDAIRKTTVNGSDFFLAVFKKDMKSLVYGTFYGENQAGERGDHVDGGTCRFSKTGTIYHAVCGSCSGTQGFPTTPGAWSKTNSSRNCNNAVFKISLDLEASFQMQDPKNGFDIITSGSNKCLKDVFFKYLALGADIFVWEIYSDTDGRIYQQSTQKDFTFTFTKSGTYTVILNVVNFSSCAIASRATQTLKIQIPPFVVNDSVAVCKKESIRLSASGADTYQWFPADGLDNPNIATPLASPENTTIYTVTLTKGTCTSQRKVKVEVLPRTDLDFKYKILKECNTAFRIQLTKILPTDSTKLNFTWDMGDGTTYTGTNPPIHSYKEAGRSYNVVMSVENESKCVSKKTVVVTLPKPPASPPNVITPNGDNLNDTFAIYEKNYELEIFTRWGKKIFSSPDYQNDWGKDVEGGIYYYRMLSPEGVECKGWIEVLR
jgi:hypothetical protein